MIPLEKNQKIFTNLSGLGGWNLVDAQGRGDWIQTKKILAKGRSWLLNEITESGLRGRGGAGFLTGKKWSLLPENLENKPVYLIVNADESEPGACKDRDILNHEPHKLLESILISAFTVKSHTAYLYIRGEYVAEYNRLKNALEEAYAQKLLGKNAAGSGWDLDIYLHRGAGAYIGGEESALIESMEGKKGFPRLKPPYPAVSGLYGCPTIINNVETIASISTIVRRGSDWYKKSGTPLSPGTKIYSISGHVNKPCNVEEALGVPLKWLIETYAGGVRGGWDNLLAIIPGGVSMPLLPKHICDTITMDYENLKEVYSGLGTGSIIVIDQSVDIIKLVAQIARFYMIESCGQCTPCREGTGWVWRILERMIIGKAQMNEIDQLWSMTKQMEGRTICAFGEAAAWPVQGLIRHFRHEIEKRIHIYQSAKNKV